MARALFPAQIPAQQPMEPALWASSFWEETEESMRTRAFRVCTHSLFVSITGTLDGKKLYFWSFYLSCFFYFYFKIAEKIHELTPSWNDEKIYQETRRIVVAELQNIVFREFLPAILGADTVPVEVNSAYDSSQDATVLNVFATAAYRFGHTLISKSLHMPGGPSTYDLAENFFNIKYAY